MATPPRTGAGPGRITLEELIDAMRELTDDERTILTTLLYMLDWRRKRMRVRESTGVHAPM